MDVGGWELGMDVSGRKPGMDAGRGATEVEGPEPPMTRATRAHRNRAASLPLLAALAWLPLTACGSDETAPSASGADPSGHADEPADELARGAEIYRQQLCQNCHIDGMGFAPELRGLSAIWKRDDLARYIRNPTEYAKTDARVRALAADYPRTMTAYPTLTDEELGALAAYLLSLE
jgi:mono/diheme cytochrome c family protein